MVEPPGKIATDTALPPSVHRSINQSLHIHTVVGDVAKCNLLLLHRTATPLDAALLDDATFEIGPTSHCDRHATVLHKQLTTNAVAHCERCGVLATSSATTPLRHWVVLDG